VLEVPIKAKKSLSDYQPLTAFLIFSRTLHFVIYCKSISCIFAFLCVLKGVAAGVRLCIATGGRQWVATAVKKVSAPVVPVATGWRRWIATGSIRQPQKYPAWLFCKI